MRRLMALVAAVLIAAPATATQTAIGFSILEDFEGYAPGPRSINFCHVPDPSQNCLGVLSGGDVAAGGGAFPAFSGSQVYTGSNLTLAIPEFWDFSWPAIAFRISTSAPVLLTVFEYDANADAEVAFFGQGFDAGLTNFAFALGSEDSPLFVTRFTLASDNVFAIDDLVMGLPNVLPGIPEPGSWAMLIAGFGLTGVVLRRRRATPVAT